MIVCPVAQSGWPAPQWAVIPTTDGRIGLRIVERHHVTGMIDLSAEEAERLAKALTDTIAYVAPPDTGEAL